MAVNLQQIRHFEATQNPSEAWIRWKKDFCTYITALKYHKEDSDTQVALFLHVCGDELKKHYESLDIKKADKCNYPKLEDILLSLDLHYAAYKNLTFASFIFWGLNQKPSQTFDQFLAEVNQNAIQCEFGSAQDRNVKDKLIQGINDNSLRERLLRDNTMTLEKVITSCKAAELSKTHANAMTQQTKINSVDELRKPNSSQNNKKIYKKRNHTQKGSPAPQPQAQGKPVNSNNCSNCARSHQPRQCPAYGSVCTACEKPNHWAVCCRSNRANPNQPQNRKLHELANTGENPLFIGELFAINEIHSVANEWMQDVTVEKHNVTFKLDTGAQVNVMPEDVISKWTSPPVVISSNTRVSTYTGSSVPIKGECTLKCSVKNSVANLKFLITTLPSRPILGAQACQQLDLVRRVQSINQSQKNTSKETMQSVVKTDHPNRKSLDHSKDTPESIIKEFSDVFMGQGRLPGTYKIHLKPGATPHVAAPRKVPLAIQEGYKKELERMKESGVIVEVNDPTEWVNNLVPIIKKGKIRLCLDPRPLNKEIQRPRYPLPTEDQLFAGLQNCKIFSLLDAKDGFWHMKLDEASSLLTTFVTPWGRYKFLVMPFGLNCAPEEFQRAMNETFSAEPRLNPYFDDIPVGTKNMLEHCQLLRRTFEIARSKNLKFNLAKVQLAKSEITFMGHLITSTGIKPDPAKLAAIQAFATPKDKQDLLRFLGLMTYLGKFTPHLSNATHALRSLLKQDVQWAWNATFQEHFERAKQILARPPVLAYFNPNQQIVVSVDASKFGIGALLLQNDRPIACASATLTEVQQRYSQIEKELLAVVYGLERFNYYTYGREVEVQTDHKPLLGLSTKPYDKISPRLQRFLLRLNHYSITLTFVPGKQLIAADAFSRAPNPNETFDAQADQPVSAKLHVLVNVTDERLVELKELTAQDSEMQTTLEMIRIGWPNSQKDTPLQARLYWHCKEELHESDGLLLRGQRIVIPEAARPEILSKLHIAHRGITACTSKAREAIYWPRMTTDIHEFISRCETCQQNQRQNQKEPLIDREVPYRPWQKLAIDFFELDRNHYIIFIDYFSKYPEVHLMTSTTASSTITAMKSAYARFGIPEEVVSDQGPPFSSEEVKRFHAEWGIRHTKSSPLYPRSNGQVERAVQTIKNSLKKAKQDNQDLYQVLLDFRATPVYGLQAPSELLMGRKLRTQIPIHPENLKPAYDIQNAEQSLIQRQRSQHKHGDNHTRELEPLDVKDRIWFWHSLGQGWTKGTITKVGPQPRSYLIQADNQTFYRRNRFHIKKGNQSESVQRSAENYIDDYGTQQNQNVQYQPPAAQQPVQYQPQAAAVPALAPEDPNADPDDHVYQTRSGRKVKTPARYMD